MLSLLELITHLLLSLLKLCRPGGVKAVMADNLVLTQQLIVLNRNRSRAPQLKTQDRWLLGVVAGFIADFRLHKIAVAIKPSTLLKFHKALVKRKYKLLYSNQGRKKPGRHGPSQKMIDLVVEIKQKNPRFGYRRIAMKIYQSFGITISCFAVGRILRQQHGPKLGSNNDGPPWLTFISNMTDCALCAGNHIALDSSTRQSQPKLRFRNRHLFSVQLSAKYFGWFKHLDPYV